MALGDELPSWSAFIGLLPLIFGAVMSAVHTFLEPRKDLRNRAKLLEKVHLEKIAVHLLSLLNHSRQIDNDVLLRGDGHNEPDLIYNYIDSTFKLIRMSHRLAIMRLAIRLCYDALLLTVLVGVVLTGVGLIWPASRFYVFLIAGLTVTVQIIAVICISWLASRMDQYEDTP